MFNDYMIKILIAIIFVDTCVALYGENVCQKEIKEMTEFKVPFTVAIPTHSVKFCLEWPLLCSTTSINYEQRWKTETKINKYFIDDCCPGYGQTGERCVPVCVNQCIHGVCVDPETCVCDPGWTGSTCNQLCPIDKWGQNCANDCQCLHDSQCTAQTGDCRCSPGWVGDHCQTPCKVGRYGSGCRRKCRCQRGLCDKQTGECDCEPGYTGRWCTESDDTNNGSQTIANNATEPESAPIEMNSTERLSTWMFIGCIAAIVGLLLPVLTIGAVIYLKRQKRWLRNVRIDRMTTFSSKPNAPDRQAVSNRSYDMTHVTPGCVYNKAVNHKFNKTNVKLLNNNLLNMNLNVNSLVDSMDGQSVMSDESLYARNQYHSIDELKEIVAQRDDPYDDVSNPKNNKEVENNDYDRLDTNRPNNTLNANYKKLNTDGLDVNKLQELTGIQTSNVQKYINHFEKQ